MTATVPVVNHPMDHWIDRWNKLHYRSVHNNLHCLGSRTHRYTNVLVLFGRNDVGIVDIIPHLN